MVVRACGTREMGGVYVEVPTSPFGEPIEHFLVDPPMGLNQEMIAQMGISPIGVQPFPETKEDGRVVYHVMDWIGADSYPHPADWIEEARRFGISRRIPKTFPFGLLTPESQLYVIHGKAYVKNYEEAYRHIDPDVFICPGRRKPEHLIQPLPDIPTCCAGLMWHTVVPKSEDSMVQPEIETQFLRKLPAFEYVARTAVGWEPKFQTAIFGRFPIARLAVINDPVSGKHVDAMDAAKHANLPVNLEDE